MTLPRVVAGAAAAAGLAILAAWGVRAFAVYAFFVLVAGAGAYGARAGGDWVRDTSRGRFDDDRR